MWWVALVACVLQIVVSLLSLNPVGGLVGAALLFSLFWAGEDDPGEPSY